MSIQNSLASPNNSITWFTACPFGLRQRPMSHVSVQEFQRPDWSTSRPTPFPLREFKISKRRCQASDRIEISSRQGIIDCVSSGIWSRFIGFNAEKRWISSVRAASWENWIIRSLTLINIRDSFFVGRRHLICLSHERYFQALSLSSISFWRKPATRRSSGSSNLSLLNRLMISSRIFKKNTCEEDI